METRLWLLLAILLLAGCAQGYYETPQPYPQVGPTMNWYQNPETESEYQWRLFKEESTGS